MMAHDVHAVLVEWEAVSEDWCVAAMASVLDNEDAANRGNGTDSSEEDRVFEGDEGGSDEG